MPKTLPKISIITPSYNQGQYIEQTIKSVLSQDYPDLEYIIIDGESTDNTISILERYKNKLNYFSEKDNGQSDAINKGIKKATGEIIGYLNSDDFYLPRVLTTVGEFFNNYKNITWTTGGCKIVGEDGRRIRSWISSWKSFWLYNNLSYRLKRVVLLIFNFISQPATFWRAEMVQEIGLFNESLKYTMDYDYWLRLIKKHPFGVIPTDLAAFRVQDNSKSVTGIVNQLNEGYDVVRKYTDSSLLIILHKMHDFLVTNVYKNLNRGNNG